MPSLASVVPIDAPSLATRILDLVRSLGGAAKYGSPKPEPVEAEEPEDDAEPEWDPERTFRRRMWVAYAKASGQRTAGHQDDHRVDEAAAERWADRVLMLMVAGVRLREAVSAATGAGEEGEVSA